MALLMAMVVLSLLGLIAARSGSCLAAQISIPNFCAKAASNSLEPLEDIHSMPSLAHDLVKNRAGDYFCLMQSKKGKITSALIVFREGVKPAAVTADAMKALAAILDVKYQDLERAKNDKILEMCEIIWANILSAWGKNERHNYLYPEWRIGITVDMRTAIASIDEPGSILIK